MANASLTLFHSVLPPAVTSGDRHPAIILLHGRGSNEEDLLDLAPALDPRLFTISVRAPFAFPYGGYTWYELLDIGKPEPAQFVESCTLLSRFLSDVRTSYPVDPARMLLFGFSMGSMMSFAMALSQPQDIRGIVAHSGYIPEGTTLDYKWNALRHTAFFVAHGVHDPVVPVSFGRRAEKLLAEAGAPHEYHEYPVGHTIGDQSLADAVRWMKPLIDNV